MSEGVGDLSAILKALDDLPLIPPPGPGGYAELADENKPDGTVHVKNSEGVILMSMPRSVYEDFRSYVAEGIKEDECSSESRGR